MTCSKMWKTIPALDSRNHKGGVNPTPADARGRRLSATTVRIGTMAYDEDLADRIRAMIPDPDGVTERKMFGGHAFLLDGHMAVAASGQDGLMVRVDPEETDALVKEAGVTRFEMRGRSL